MSLVYKILPQCAWDEALARGRFDGSAIDLKDGFIHLSSAAQAQDTARLHFRGQDDLLLVALPVEALGDALKWESSRGGGLFPHLFGALDPKLAVEARPLALDADGVPQLGALA